MLRQTLIITVRAAENIDFVKREEEDTKVVKLEEEDTVTKAGDDQEPRASAASTRAVVAQPSPVAPPLALTRHAPKSTHTALDLLG